MPFQRILLQKWTQYREWSLNLLSTMSQSDTLVTTPLVLYSRVYEIPEQTRIYLPYLTLMNKQGSNP